MALLLSILGPAMQDLQEIVEHNRLFASESGVEKLKVKLLKGMNRLCTNPYLGRPATDSLYSLRGGRIFQMDKRYRIAYLVREEDQIIYIMSVLDAHRDGAHTS